MNNANNYAHYWKDNGKAAGRKLYESATYYWLLRSLKIGLLAFLTIPFAIIMVFLDSSLP